MKDTQIFENKNFTELLKDIHDATLTKRETILELVGELRKLINNPESAVMIAPIVREYLDVLVRSDEHMIKVAAIVQRVITADALGKGGGDLNDILSPEEKDKLLKDALKELDKTVEAIKNQVPAPILPSGSVTR
jgi:hypothetical protein